MSDALGYYILDGHTPIKATYEQFCAWFAQRSSQAEQQWGDVSWRVALTTVNGITVSTVFLGIDHAYSGGPPVLFETMVFGGPLAEQCERYSTWDEAAAGHEAMVQRVKEEQAKLRADPCETVFDLLVSRLRERFIGDIEPYRTYGAQITLQFEINDLPSTPRARRQRMEVKGAIMGIIGATEEPEEGA